MEKVGSLECKTVISELTQGRELANQLKNELHPVKSREACGFLVEKILSSYENALSLLNCVGILGETSPVSAAILESPNSIVGTPNSEGSNPFYEEQNQRDVFKKRKILSKWSEEVRVCSVIGQEGLPDDGYNWRKYGQKDILGASFPRAYYRCTHRHTRRCFATKHVQKSDEDPSMFEISYRGRHTCVQERPKQNKEDQSVKEEGSKHGPGIKVETPVVSVLEPAEERNLTESYTSPFVSPATSECNYLSESLCQMNDFWVDQNLQWSESDFTDMVSTPISVTNSLFRDWDFPADQVEFDPSFTLDTSKYF